MQYDHYWQIRARCYCDAVTPTETKKISLLTSFCWVLNKLTAICIYDSVLNHNLVSSEQIKGIYSIQPTAHYLKTWNLRGRLFVWFVVDKAVMGQIFLGVLPYWPVSIIPSVLHTHSSITNATILAPDSMQQSPSREENKSSAGQEIPRILRNAKVHF